jgi:hypothetical protein
MGDDLFMTRGKQDAEVGVGVQADESSANGASSDQWAFISWTALERPPSRIAW